MLTDLSRKKKRSAAAGSDSTGRTQLGIFLNCVDGGASLRTDLGRVDMHEFYLGGVGMGIQLALLQSARCETRAVPQQTECIPLRASSLVVGISCACYSIQNVICRVTPDH